MVYLADQDINEKFELYLTFGQEEIFSDGFESGNTTEWSTTIP